MIIATACLLASLAWPVAAQASPLGVERMGVYVVADDLPRSIDFYRSVFGEEPEVRLPNFAGFEVAGGLYAVVSRAAYAPDAVAGTSTLPYIKVRDIDAAFARVSQVAPDSLVTPEVQGEGAFRFFKARDPSGNLIEFFSVTTP